MSTVVADSTVASSRLSDYAELCKPRIMTMVLISMAVAGVVAGLGNPNWVWLINALVGTGLVAASSSVFNQILERFPDSKMPRTRNRPLAARRLGTAEAAAFGTLLFMSGVLYLLLTVNAVTTFWAVMTWILYVCIYTPMKRMTVLNTPVGAIPGALPILVGWTAVSGGAVDRRAFWLFALLFIWQFPHFMAIAWLYKRQYAEAGFRMLSYRDLHGRKSGSVALLGAALLFVLVLLQPIIGMATIWATLPAALLALGQLAYAVSFFRSATDVTARRLLRASLLFLPATLTIITLSQFAIL